MSSNSRPDAVVAVRLAGKLRLAFSPKMMPAGLTRKRLAPLAMSELLLVILSSPSMAEGCSALMLERMIDVGFGSSR